MMPFIGAKSETWRSILWYNGSLAGMVSHYAELMGLSLWVQFNGTAREDSSWDIDQHITTYAIVANKLCSLQKSNKVFKAINTWQDMISNVLMRSREG